MLSGLRRLASRVIIKALERRARAKLRKHPRVWDYLSKVLTSSTGCSFNDSWVLYSYVRLTKPREVLELGSGISTAVIAYAMQENGFGRLTSMEESAEYAAQTRSTLPAELLEDRKISIEVRHSPAIEKRHGLFVGVGYAEIPARAYEFVFVDGPHYDRETSYDVDLSHIVRASDIPVTAMIDSRAGSCVVYNLFLKDKFRFDYFQNIGWLSAATRADMASFHDVIRRECNGHSIRRTLRM